MKYLRSLMQQSVTACKNQAKLIQQFTLSLYNPQNEMFATFQTKRYFIQNETSSKK